MIQIARGNGVGEERRDVTECERGKEFGGDRRDVTD